MKKALLLTSALAGFVLISAPASAGADQEPNDQAAAAEPAAGETAQGFQDLNDKLTESRAVPHFENGQPAGYERTTPTQLSNGQVIRTVDGQTATPPRAFEMLSTGMLTNHRIDTVLEDEDAPGGESQE